MNRCGMNNKIKQRFWFTVKETHLGDKKITYAKSHIAAETISIKYNFLMMILKDTHRNDFDLCIHIIRMESCLFTNMGSMKNWTSFRYNSLLWIKMNKKCVSLISYRSSVALLPSLFRSKWNQYYCLPICIRKISNLLQNLPLIKGNRALFN